MDSPPPPSPDSRPLDMLFLPFLAPSHLMPLFETARLTAARGQHVTVIVTPYIASTLQHANDVDTASGHPISLHVIPFPAKEVGLPDGLEFFTDATDMQTRGKLFRAFNLLRPKMEEFIVTRRPDCVVSDMFYPWTADLGIPRLHFHVSNMFFLCVEDAARRHRSIELYSDYDPFVIPHLPHPISMTRSQLPDSVRDPSKSTPLEESWKEGELKSYGLLVNSFYELEPAYTEHYKRLTGLKVFNIGPVALLHPSSREKALVRSEHECLSWLSSKKPNSVLYVCFGTGGRFPDAQLMELARGLEASGHQFIWVVSGRNRNDGEEEEEERWLPRGFRETMAGRGIIVKGWAPQVLILGHPSVGGFLSHCGWNSLTEGVCAGVPIVTWPLYADQFYSEKLVTEVLKIGVEVGAEDWVDCYNVGTKKVIKRESIAKAVKRLMDGGDEVVGMMRQRVKELAQKAKIAVEEGGSSHNNLTNLIDELKKIRSQN